MVTYRCHRLSQFWSGTSSLGCCCTLFPATIIKVPSFQFKAGSSDLDHITLLLLNCPALLLLHGAALPLVNCLALLPTLGLQEALLRHLCGLPDQGAGLPILLERSSKWMRDSTHKVGGCQEKEGGLKNITINIKS